MPSTAGNGQNIGYACRCLNVRVHSRPPPQTPPQDPVTDYTPLYVGEDGISVAHTQLTLRSRTRAKPLHDDPNKLARYVSLTCLICQTLVYHVYQVITPDVESGEGPIPPTEDWTEQEMLKSSSGWIEVFKDCITGDAIAQAEASPLYSRTFCIILPSGVSSSASAIPSYSAPSQSSPQSSPQTTPASPKTHLPPLPPLFLQPPFTPSHPVFRHISSIASDKSTRLRTEAEEYLSQVVREKVAEIETEEAKLRKEVELLWEKWRDSMHQVEQDLAQAQPRRRQSSGTWTGPTSPASGTGPNGTPASIRINDFVPIHAHSRRSSSMISPNYMSSALSASLATGSFYHPRAQVEAQQGGTDLQRRRSNGTGAAAGSPPPYSSNPPSPSSGIKVRSPATASTRTLAVATNGEAIGIREAYRRNMDEGKDIATSFKYVMDMEEQIQAIQKQQQERAPQESESSSIQQSYPSTSVVARGRSPRTNKSAIKKPKAAANGDAVSSPSTDKRSSSRSEHSHKDTTKGKRKVTFDVKPDVAIIDGDVSAERQNDTAWQEGQAEDIFEFENELGDRSDNGDLLSPLTVKPATTPTSEPVRAPIRPSRPKSTNMSGLPSSLSTLRPASLPLPSAIRSPVAFRTATEEKKDDRPRSELVKEAVISPLQEDFKRHRVEKYQKPPVEEEGDEDKEVDQREAEILRLVAASTPSHRSAWKRDSKAWQLFVNRQDKKPKGGMTQNVIAEEEEDSTAESISSRAGYYDESEDEDVSGDDELRDHRTFLGGIAASLPIAIAPLHQGRQKFGVPSYQPKTSLSDRPGILVPPLQNSVALRRAAYAERDRSRSIDPGALDFAADEDEEDDEDETDTDGDVGGKGRQRALKILKARNEIPAAGMWRSFA